MVKKFYTLFIGFVLTLNTMPLLANRIDSIDVLHYNIETKLRNLSSKQIIGTSTLTSIVKYAQTKSLVLDLLKFAASSVQCNGNPVVYSQTDSTLHINLGRTYTIGDTLMITIEYAGPPTTDARWGGFYFTGNYAYNMGVGMASNPPNFGRCWFPCIDNFTDKATYEFHITTDSGYMAVCNGIQSPVTPATNNGLTWHWHLEQEIPTYIANVAVSKYVLVNQVYQGIKRNIPITLAVEAKDTNNIKASFAKLNSALQCFEDKFGPYEFDRVGYVGVPFTSGAMEHAGNISYPLYAIDGTTTYETLFAHELSHHWFGNLVTTSTAADMWLNEGWASYCEALFLECVYGKEAYDTKMNSELFESLRWAHVRDGGYLPVSGVPLGQTYGTHVYTKGSLMAHSLRILVNNDTAFFNTLKSYFASFKFKTANTGDFQKHFEKRFGGMITSFFNSYIYDKGHLDFQIKSTSYEGSGLAVWSNVMSRHKSIYPVNIPIYLYLSFTNKTTSQIAYFLIPFSLHSSGLYKGIIGRTILDEYNLNDRFNEKSGMMNGVTQQSELVNDKNVKSFPNALFTFTPTETNGPAYVYAEHHFARPFIDEKENTSPPGIIISSERYWQIGGWNKNSFKATAFFAYDGSTPSSKNAGFLDNELIKNTEDSLVLLYRLNSMNRFTIATDLTFQPGPSKTDKIGRFWVKDLIPGEYVFGYRDVTASVGKVQSEVRTIKIYPNPTDSHLTVEFPANHAAGNIRVMDLKGNTVLESKFNKNDLDFKVNTANWTKGSYILIFEDEKGKLTQNFIVK